MNEFLDKSVLSIVHFTTELGVVSRNKNAGATVVRGAVRAARSRDEGAAAHTGLHDSRRRQGLVRLGHRVAVDTQLVGQRTDGGEPISRHERSPRDLCTQLVRDLTVDRTSIAATVSLEQNLHGSETIRRSITSQFQYIRLFFIKITRKRRTIGDC